MRLTAFALILAGGFALPDASHGQSAVTVIGGGLARDCYEAVESRSAPAPQALRICDLALEQETLSRKDMAATRINRGILHLREGRHARALEDFETGLALAPHLAEAKVNHGAALYNLGRYPEALETLSLGVTAEADQARAVAYYNRPLTFEKLGDVRAAYDDFRMALAIRPEFEAAAEQLKRFSVIPAAAQ